MSDGWSYSLKYEGRTVEVPSGRSVIGRSRTCDLSISGPSISRRHVDLIANAGKLIVQDLGSSNGTFINGERIRGQGELNDGDKLRLGDIRMGVEIRRTIPAWTPKAEKKDQRPTRGRDIASLAPPMGALPKSTILPPSETTVNLRDIDPDELDTAVGVELEDEEKDAIAGDRHEKPSEPHLEAESPGDNGEKHEQITASELPTLRAPFPKGLEAEELDSEGLTHKGQRPEGQEPRVSPARAHFLAASFERRLIAGLIDAMWTIGIGVTVFMKAGPIFGGATFAAIGFVLCAGWAIWGTTPGKQLLGLYVCNEEGEVGIGWTAALLRLVGYLLTILSLGVGFLMAARPSRRAFHDTFSKTQVRHRISL